jgi:hypothetical protein
MTDPRRRGSGGEAADLVISPVTVARDLAGAAAGVARLPADLTEAANILLTTDRAVIGTTPRDVVWTHRKTTLYRYRSRSRRPRRSHPARLRAHHSHRPARLTEPRQEPR